MLDVIEEEKDHSYPYGPFRVERIFCRTITGDTP